MKYELTEEIRQALVQYLSEAPAKYTLKAINTLLELEPVKDDTIKPEPKRKGTTK